MSIADDALNALTSGAKGAAAGAILGPVGAGVGGLVGVGMALLPGVAHLLGADDATSAKVAATVSAVTGAVTGQGAQAAIDADPAMAADLRIQLAQIAADRQAEDNRSDEARLTLANADTQRATQQMLQAAQAGSGLEWGAPVVSVIVLVSFGTLCGLLLFRAVPTESQTLLNILLGTLGTMASTVVAFWVGSSAGSNRKTELLAQSVPSSMTPHPAAIVPAGSVKQ